MQPSKKKKKNNPKLSLFHVLLAALEVELHESQMYNKEKVE